MPPVNLAALSAAVAALATTSSAAPVVETPTADAAMVTAAVDQLATATESAAGVAKALLSKQAAPPGAISAIRKSLLALEEVSGKFANVVVKAELDPYTVAMVTIDAARKRLWGASDMLDKGDTDGAVEHLKAISEMLSKAASAAGDVSKNVVEKAQVKMTAAQFGGWVQDQIAKAQGEDETTAKKRLAHLGVVTGMAKALSVESEARQEPAITVEMECAYAPAGAQAGKMMDLTVKTDQSAETMKDAPTQPTSSNNFSANSVPAAGAPAASPGNTSLDTQAQPTSNNNFATNNPVVKMVNDVAAVLKSHGIEVPDAKPAGEVAKSAPADDQWPMDLNKSITYGKAKEPVAKGTPAWGKDPSGLRA